MNLLVLARFDKDSQNPKIMRILSDEWEKSGYTVIRFFPYSKRWEAARLKKKSGVYPLYLEDGQGFVAFQNDLSLYKNRLGGLLLHIMKHPCYSVRFLISRVVTGQDDMTVRGIGRHIAKAVKKHAIDVIVASSNPFSFPLAAAQLDLNVKKIWYQLDPHAENGMMSQEAMRLERQKEQYVYAKMDRIIVQHHIKDMIDVPDDIKHKLLPLEFPLIKANEDIEPDRKYFESNSISCVFAGALMLPIRMPDYMLKLFSMLGENISLYIWSSNLSEGQKEKLCAMLHDNEKYMGRLPQKEMREVLAGADVLVNLGNSESNQFPSKILDYISLGKPIINIYKIPNCLTVKVLEKYPLAISLFEGDNIEENAEKARLFIESSRGKRIEAEEIERLYSNYLPHRVAEKALC